MLYPAGWPPLRRLAHAGEKSGPDPMTPGTVAAVTGFFLRFTITIMAAIGLEDGTPDFSPAAFRPAISFIRQCAGIVLHDIMVEGVFAFRKDDFVKVQEIGPDPARPECKYVVTPKTLNKRFPLSGRDPGL